MRLFSMIVYLIRAVLRLNRGDPGILSAELELEESPRSLNGCDSLLMPQIQKDFPDYDPELAKTYVRGYLKDQLGHHPGFSIHNVVIAKYLRSGAQKCIVFQAALCWLENGRKLQKRYALNYTYMLPDGTTAANCPNCGGALGYGVQECPYCGSRVVNALKNTWTFTEMKEC